MFEFDAVYIISFIIKFYYLFFRSRILNFMIGKEF